MEVRPGACAVCSASCLGAVRDGRVAAVAGANWVEIRHCRECGAYWDMQPGNYPAVITLEEALRRVPDPAMWHHGRGR